MPIQKNLFDENHSQPTYKLPVTAKTRRFEIDKRIALQAEAEAAWHKDLKLGQFKAQEQSAQYVGTNVYIKPSYVVTIPEYCFFNKLTGELTPKNERPKSDKQIQNENNLKNNLTHGQLSFKAIQSIKNAINWMLVSTRNKRVFSQKTQSTFQFKIAFITLTLPDTDTRVTNAVFQRSLLNPFLVYLRKYHQLKNYVWKMEFQENGKLHCHITIDTFVHWRDIRKAWNRVLRNNGFLSKFERAHGHSDPNSTDIHSIRKVRNLAAYLAKYMAKNKELSITHEGKEYWFTPVIDGRIWSCNYELSRAKTCKVHIPADQTAQELKTMFKPAIEFKDLLRMNPLTKVETKIGEIFYTKAINWISDIKGVIKETFDKTRNEIQSAARHFSNYELSL